MTTPEEAVPLRLMTVPTSFTFLLASREVLRITQDGALHIPPDATPREAAEAIMSAWSGLRSNLLTAERARLAARVEATRQARPAFLNIGLGRELYHGCEKCGCDGHDCLCGVRTDAHNAAVDAVLALLREGA